MKVRQNSDGEICHADKAEGDLGWYVCGDHWSSYYGDVAFLEHFSLIAPEPPPKPTEDNLHRFSTGAVRSKEGSSEAWHLIPAIGLRSVAETAYEGHVHYPPDEKTNMPNWKKGMPVSQLLNRAIRHLYLFLSGDRSENHLGHSAWNILAAIETQSLRPDMMDVYEPEKAAPAIAEPWLAPDEPWLTTESIHKHAESDK
jgi:hypothetical protein